MAISLRHLPVSPSKQNMRKLTLNLNVRDKSAVLMLNQSGLVCTNGATMNRSRFLISRSIDVLKMTHACNKAGAISNVCNGPMDRSHALLTCRFSTKKGPLPFAVSMVPPWLCGIWSSESGRRHGDRAGQHHRRVVWHRVSRRRGITMPAGAQDATAT